MLPEPSKLENQTVITMFILLGLSNNPHIQDFFLFLFMIIFLVTIMGNVLIILVIKSELHLQTPMFFFSQSFSFCRHLLFLRHHSQDAGKLPNKAENYFLGRMYCTNILHFPNSLYRNFYSFSNGL